MIKKQDKIYLFYVISVIIFLFLTTKYLDLEELKVNGNFVIEVSNTLPIVVVGNVDVPPTWIDATIGYLNQAEKVYKLKVVVEEGSEVRFIDED